jgi:hypothetical protein
MIWISIITFWVPGFIPFMNKGLSFVGYMNSIFLVMPPIGAALTTVFRVYNVTILSVIQVSQCYYKLTYIDHCVFLYNYPSIGAYKTSTALSFWSSHCTYLCKYHFLYNNSSYGSVFATKWLFYYNDLPLGKEEHGELRPGFN